MTGADNDPITRRRRRNLLRPPHDYYGMLTKSLVKRSDVTAFEETYVSLYPRLVRMAAATTMSVALAEEIVQEAFTDALPRWESIHYPEAWLRRAVLNKSTSWVRRQILERRVRRLSDRASTNSAPDSIGLDSALRKLTASQRAVVFLKYYDELTESEMAQAMNCPVGTIKSRLSRARDVLRKELE